jgi:preprotein translocase subunit SecA
MESILKELEQNRGYFPREAIEEAIRRREEITPHLMRALKEAVDLYAKTLADDIRGTYEEGLLWPGYMQPEEVEEMHWWACFSPRKESRSKPAEPFRAAAGRQDTGTGVRSAPKVGRNAPCPCGSGKKYKRCCGR